MLDDAGIKLLTTKTGDVLVYSTGRHAGAFEAVNLISNSNKISSVYRFTSRKARLLSFNDDTIRQIYAPKRSYPRG